MKAYYQNGNHASAEVYYPDSHAGIDRLIFDLDTYASVHMYLQTIVLKERSKNLKNVLEHLTYPMETETSSDVNVIIEGTLEI